MAEEKKVKNKVADIIINRFLADVDSKGTMPWQRPYERYNAFNYFTMKTYRGINRLILPFGEYITKHQINTYNKVNKEDYRFQKGIEWYPVVFFTQDKKDITREEVEEAFEGKGISIEDGYIGTEGVWNYYYLKNSNRYYKIRNVMRFYEVADRKWFRNSKGEMLPSRIDTEEVTISLEEPKKVIDDYIKRSGVDVVYDSADVPCYIPALDRVELNPYMEDEESWFSTAFHEFAHSTGHRSRLNRRGIHKPAGEDKDNLYAVEECIAEITASLLCAECGVYDYETSGTKEYDNNVAYVQAWKKRVKDWGKEFIYIVSQADKAFNFILGDTEDMNR